MPKEKTKNIQSFLVEIGNKLGFESLREYSFSKKRKVDSYDPIYDVVWFLNLSEFNVDILKKYIPTTSYYIDLKKIPLATFEIEGSTTTSKNQVGNFVNLLLNPSLFKFVIVNNSGAKEEYDTYRRGIKIQRTFSNFMGEKNIIFCDWSQLKNNNLSLNLSHEDKKITFSKLNINNRSAVGGEKGSIDVFNRIITDFSCVGMEIKQNYTPETLYWQYEKVKLYQSIDANVKFDFLLKKKYVYDPVTKQIKTLKNIKQYFYLPKVDLALGFFLPNSFNIFLKFIAVNMREEVVNFPLLLYILKSKKNKLFFPYLGVEIESNVNKHLNGGLLNCSLFFYLGLIISPARGKSHISTYKNLCGLNNVFHYDKERIFIVDKK